MLIMLFVMTAVSLLVTIDKRPLNSPSRKSYRFKLKIMNLVKLTFIRL